MPESDTDLTAGLIAEAVGGRLIAGDPAAVVSGISIDSRTLAPGELFFALRGERFDGHAFLEAALERGAAGLLISRLPEQAPGGGRDGLFVIVVDDTLAALQALGRHVRRASGAKVVAITGSAGKTTTKEVTAAFLATRYRVFRNKGNLNNHIGLPLSLTELRHRPDIAVVELGMNHAGEIRTLVGIAEPEVRVWTNVAAVHSAFFPSLEHIADAKAEILERAAPTDLLVANADDPRVMARAPRFAGQLQTFGMGHRADVMASGVQELGLDGMAATITTPAGSHRLRVPLLGRGNLANVLAATVVALHFQIPLDRIVMRAATVEPAPHRGQVLRLRRGVTIIDDSYNSNPAALDRALEVLARETRCERRVAVLGEMLELGREAMSLHEQAGRRVAAAGVELLVTIGEAPARALGAAAVRAGLAPGAVLHFGTSPEAADSVRERVKAGDLVLVKGSRGIRTELVVAGLQAEFA